MTVDVTPELVLELWLSLSPSISSKEKTHALEAFLRILEEYGYDLDSLDEIHGEDSTLDAALDNLKDEAEEEDEDEYSEYED